MTDIDWGDYAHFEESEFRCRGTDCCGNLAQMVPSFMFRLQRIRDVYRRPIIITSGYRCAVHNMQVGGAIGVHPSGHAADIAVRGRDCFALLTLAAAKGMTGIGVKQHGDNRFLHLDDLSGPTRPWVWGYS